MRLTLRTLLAWLDDTLPAQDVRQIGQQVHDSPVAKDLVDRIHKVTRQRRLTIPGANNTEATDPNVVAEYLDSHLDAEQVAGFEKRCLTSDVHLAEVACTHQILSLLGQKAKVPPAARHRMYRLTRGAEPEGLSRSRVAAVVGQSRLDAGGTPSLVGPKSSRAGGLERIGVPAAVIGLVGLLGWSTWWSLAPSRDVESESPPDPVGAFGGGVGPMAGGRAKPAPGVAMAPAAPVGAGPDLRAGNPVAGAGPVVKIPAPPEPMPAGGIAEAVTVEPARGPAVAAVQPADGTLARLVEATNALAVRRKAGESAWDRLTAESGIQAGDRVVGLEPFRTMLTLGPNGKVVLVGDSAVEVARPEANELARLSLVAGRVTLPDSATGTSIALAVSPDLALRLTPAAGATVGAERIDRLSPATGRAEEPSLHLFAFRGGVEVTDGQATATLAEGQSVHYSASTGFGTPAAAATPEWMATPDASVTDQELGRQFARYFKKDTPPLTSLVEATVDERAPIRALALGALSTLGQTTVLVGAFNSQNEAGSGLVRGVAMDGLREILARGGPAATQLHQDLVRTGGSEEWAALVEKLLAGYTPEEAADPTIQSSLVGLLKSDDVGVRDLAIRNLLAISNRGDALGYDPEQPEGPGLARWQELLQRKEIRLPAAR